jgi:hypothetical protein
MNLSGNNQSIPTIVANTAENQEILVFNAKLFEERGAGSMTCIFH